MKKQETFEDLLDARRRAVIKLSGGLKEEIVVDENGNKRIIVTGPALRCFWDHEIQENAIEILNQGS